MTNIFGHHKDMDGGVVGLYDVDDCKMRRIVEVVVAVNELTSALPAQKSADIDGRVC